MVKVLKWKVPIEIFQQVGMDSHICTMTMTSEHPKGFVKGLNNLGMQYHFIMNLSYFLKYSPNTLQIPIRDEHELLEQDSNLPPR